MAKDTFDLSIEAWCKGWHGDDADADADAGEDDDGDYDDDYYFDANYCTCLCSEESRVLEQMVKHW